MNMEHIGNGGVQFKKWEESDVERTNIVHRFEAKVDNCFTGLYAKCDSTGYKGGDSGHGGRTFINIRVLNPDSCDVEIKSDENGISIEAKGDDEQYALIEIIDQLSGFLKKTFKG